MRRPVPPPPPDPQPDPWKEFRSEPLPAQIAGVLIVLGITILGIFIAGAVIGDESEPDTQATAGPTSIVASETTATTTTAQSSPIPLDGCNVETFGDVWMAFLTPVCVSPFPWDLPADGPLLYCEGSTGIAVVNLRRYPEGLDLVMPVNQAGRDAMAAGEQVGEEETTVAVALDVEPSLAAKLETAAEWLCGGAVGCNGNESVALVYEPGKRPSWTQSPDGTVTCEVVDEVVVEIETPPTSTTLGPFAVHNAAGCEGVDQGEGRMNFIMPEPECLDPWPFTSGVSPRPWIFCEDGLVLGLVITDKEPLGDSGIYAINDAARAQLGWRSDWRDVREVTALGADLRPLIDMGLEPCGS